MQTCLKSNHYSMFCNTHLSFIYLTSSVHYPALRKIINTVLDNIDKYLDKNEQHAK